MTRIRRLTKSYKASRTMPLSRDNRKLLTKWQVTSPIEHKGIGSWGDGQMPLEHDIQAKGSCILDHLHHKPITEPYQPLNWVWKDPWS
jgi:hypothetical protein